MTFLICFPDSRNAFLPITCMKWGISIESPICRHVESNLLINFFKTQRPLLSLVIVKFLYLNYPRAKAQGIPICVRKLELYFFTPED